MLGGNSRPGNIYNGVLLPTIGYGIKGAIWYQGESNAGRAYEYSYLFPLMIQQWRNGDGTFWMRLRHTGAIGIALLFFWSLNTWNLLGWKM